MPPRRPPTSSSSAGIGWLALIAAIAIGLAYWFWWARPPVGSPPGEAPAAVQADVPGASPAGPDGAGPGAAAEAPLEQSPAIDPAAAGSGPRHPLPPGVASASDPDLPDLAHSDAPILGALTEATPRAELGRFGNIGDFTRRVVVTVDNLPRERVPAQYSIVQRIPGALVVAEQDGATVLDAGNYRRYEAFVGFAESVGARQLARVYLRFYPLFQQEYRAMGYPDGHFHDRVVQAIDDMLAAPSPEGPVRLLQPRVHHVFADPALESLSAGRKIMIRVGPDNAARLKRLLRSIRSEIVGTAQ